MTAIALCTILGAFCIVLNVFVVSALLRNRKRALTNVFYVIVLHCAIVDLIRGVCLCAQGLPHFLIGLLRTMQGRLLVLKVLFGGFAGVCSQLFCNTFFLFLF